MVVFCMVPPSRCTCLIIISKLFFTALPIPSFDALCVCVMCVCVCVCVVSVIVKRPVLPPCVVDGRSRNPLYYYYYYLSSWKGQALEGHCQTNIRTVSKTTVLGKLLRDRVEGMRAFLRYHLELNWRILNIAETEILSLLQI